MVAESTEPQRYAKKIRIYPNGEQVTLFNKCLGATRYFYNQANAYVKDQIMLRTAERLAELDALKCNGCVHERVNKKSKNMERGRCCMAVVEGTYFCEEHAGSSLGFNYNKFLTLPHIRAQVMKSDSRLQEAEMWQKEVPYDTRQMAIKQLVDAYTTSYALKKSGHIDHFDVSYKRKKDSDGRMFRVNPDAIKGQWIFKTRLKNKAKLRVRKRDVKKIIDNPPDGFLNIIKTGDDKWYLCVPRTREPSYDNAVFKTGFVDPGVRTFATVYSPEGIVAKVGDGYAEEYLRPLAAKASRFESLYSLSKDGPQHVEWRDKGGASQEPLMPSPSHRAGNKTRRHLRRRIALLNAKIKNRVDELHNKTANFLCAAFQNIFVPRFATQSMVKRGRRKISSLTAAELLRLSHYKFMNKLLTLAKTKQRNVFIISEPYTSKTCTRCGTLNATLGGAKVHKCASCGLVVDRDYQGARNNGLQVVTKLVDEGRVN